MAKVKKENAPEYEALYDKIKEHAEKSRMEYFIWDGTHPSIAGHMLIAREWLKAVEGLDKT